MNGSILSFAFFVSVFVGPLLGLAIPSPLERKLLAQQCEGLRLSRADLWDVFIDRNNDFKFDSLQVG
jgi:hypothetical protein